MDIILSIFILGFTLSLTIIPVTGDIISKKRRKIKLLFKGYIFYTIATLSLILGIIQIVRSTKIQKERDKIQTSILENTKQVTGGDSFCQLDIGNINSNNEKGFLIFFIQGKYSLSDISATIWDLNVLDYEKLSLTDIYKQTINLGTLFPGTIFMTQFSIQLDTIKGVNLNSQFVTNAGITFQTFRMRFVNRKWVRATQITTLGTSKELFLKIDPDFPIQDKTIIFK